MCFGLTILEYGNKQKHVMQKNNLTFSTYEKTYKVVKNLKWKN